MKKRIFTVIVLLWCALLSALEWKRGDTLSVALPEKPEKSVLEAK